MRSLLLTIGLLFTFSANAASVTINSTTNPILDTTFLDTGYTHVDTTTGLEWLDFGSLVGDPSWTFAHSINSAQAAYGPSNGDWRLATYSEVYALWDRFFPAFDGGTTGTMKLVDTVDNETDPLIQSRNSWLFAFGTDAIAQVNGDTLTADGFLWSSGMYVDGNGDVQIMGLSLSADETVYTTLYGPNYDVASLTLDSAYTNLGVFMVRDYTVVPLPPAVWLFGAGLLGLVTVARRKT